jgi:predicted secreted hydrolase
MPGRWFIASVFVILALIFTAVLIGNRSGRAGDVRATLELEATLGGADTAGFARAFAPRPFMFPGDHGEHPDFRNEWWYFTGNLESDDGARFGYQLTIFRTALAASMPERESAWATRQAYMAHFALTDARAQRHVAYERFARGAAGLAGADTSPFRVWLEDWSIAQASPVVPSRPGDARAVFPLRVVARNDDVAIDLTIRAGKPLVLNGEVGLSRKGAQPGNASYYWSLTRLPTEGTVRSGANDIEVHGTSWLDREWSTSALAPGVAGWDWFALQLDDGSELMLYRLRRDDGSADPFSAGTWVDAAAGEEPLDSDDAGVDVLGEWRSPLDGAPYPSGWRIRVPSLALDVVVTAVLPDQEMNLSFRYWEGAVDVRGLRDNRPVTGRGYVELTGYAGGARGRASPSR